MRLNNFSNFINEGRLLGMSPGGNAWAIGVENKGNRDSRENNKRDRAILNDPNDILGYERRMARRRKKAELNERRMALREERTALAEERTALERERLMADKEGFGQLKVYQAQYLPNEVLIKKHRELLDKGDRLGGMDANAAGRGLDLAYKLKGLYAPLETKNMNLNINKEFKELSPERKADIDRALGDL